MKVKKNFLKWILGLLFSGLGTSIIVIYWKEITKFLISIFLGLLSCFTKNPFKLVSLILFIILVIVGIYFFKLKAKTNGKHVIPKGIDWIRSFKAEDIIEKQFFLFWFPFNQTIRTGIHYFDENDITNIPEIVELIKNDVLTIDNMLIKYSLCIDLDVFKYLDNLLNKFKNSIKSNNDLFRILKSEFPDFLRHWKTNQFYYRFIKTEKK